MKFQYGQEVVIHHGEDEETQGFYLDHMGERDDEHLNIVRVAVPEYHQVWNVDKDSLEPVSWFLWPPNEAFATEEMRARFQRTRDGKLAHGEEIAT